MPADAKSPIRLELAVTVLLEKRTIARRFWSVPAWSLAGVVVGEALVHQSRSGRQIRSAADGSESWSWSGYKVTLYKDACERYWHALIGDAPKVYVVCKEADPSEPREPLVVTIDYDEATAFAETDELVLSAPIPGDLYRYMEAFVLEHYRPQKFEKRKRRNWTAESEKERRRS